MPGPARHKVSDRIPKPGTFLARHGVAWTSAERHGTEWHGQNWISNGIGKWQWHVREGWLRNCATVEKYVYPPNAAAIPILGQGGSAPPSSDKRTAGEGSPPPSSSSSQLAGGGQPPPAAAPKGGLTPPAAAAWGGLAPPPHSRSSSREFQVWGLTLSTTQQQVRGVNPSQDPSRT